MEYSIYYAHINDYIDNKDDEILVKEGWIWLIGDTIPFRKVYRSI